MRENIVLIGGGGHAKSVIDVLEMQGRFNIIGIIDSQNVGKMVLNYQIIGTDDDLKSIFKECKNAIISVGQIKSVETRIRLFELAKSIGFMLPTIISPLAYVSKHASLGEGTIIMHQALINAGAKVGKNCIINTKALIEHDAIVGDHCHISTASVVNGGVFVGEKTFFGSNSMAREYIEISQNSVIGGGLAVMR
ncbi:sugar O-acyltransferase, sialic acid O-acetyltransferase NeuD family [Campylobacter iguaniorum]|uniref:Sugar O-acyltransferase, sialic acid O-acetyltransferase NeuD family n=1 Tax=Campylobacter iguaniorum TaxID=1244531 RepID=A0A076F8Y8_9BACT|nr:NeuD/PglB/VioB family sugar acetyltransferase [Campylobacter iguaniorum]AII13907.1 sugar O-acyltransferase, sialic acid O-acetyltransferase NeuD family [Campylobacter iguaniorum]